MSFYDDHILPVLTHLVCSQKSIEDIRRKIIPASKGIVLEVGMGSGLNLAFYQKERVSQVLGVEPSDPLRKKAFKKALQSGIHLEMVGRDASAIELSDKIADTVVLTYSLCTIPDPVSAVSEMYRILKPGGSLIFCEHGKSPDKSIARWQEKLTPWWQKISGGCSLDRPVAELLQEGGFEIQELETGYVSSLKIISHNYTGFARK